MWRKTLAMAHPDAGGDEEVFKFLNELREQIQEAQRKAEQAQRAQQRPKQPPRPQPWGQPVVIRTYGTGTGNGFNVNFG